MRLRPRLAALSAAVTLGALGWGTAAAVAEGALRVEGVVTAPALSPGSTTTHSLTVSNGRPGPVALELRLADVTGSENGCVGPELAVVGEGCDEDGGELARDLTLAVVRGEEEVWRGGLLELRRGVVLGEAMPAGAQWDVDLVVGLAPDSGNDTMTDRLDFTTVVVATDTAGEPEVAGVQTTLTGEAPAAADPAPAGAEGTTVPTVVAAGARWDVPFTDTSVGVWPLVVNGGVLLVGAVTCWRRRVRQKVCSGPGNVPPRTSSA